MKKLLGIILLCLCSAAFGQVPSASGTITASGSTCATTNACIGLHAASGVNTATITISGTYVATLQFEGSNDGINFVSLSGGSLAISTASVNVVGTWTVNIAGLTDLRVRASAYTSGTATVTLNTSTAIPNLGSSTQQGDPCQNPSITKQSAFANITTATTTQLIAVSGITSIYVCGYWLDIASTTTASTALLEYGTGGTCGTGTTVLTATMTNGTLADTFKLYGGAGQSVHKVPAGQALCVVTTVGSTPTTGITVTYVQM